MFENIPNKHLKRLFSTILTRRANMSKYYKILVWKQVFSRQKLINNNSKAWGSTPNWNYIDLGTSITGEDALKLRTGSPPVKDMMKSKLTRLVKNAIEENDVGPGVYRAAVNTPHAPGFVPIFKGEVKY